MSLDNSSNFFEALLDPRLIKPLIGVMFFVTPGLISIFYFDRNLFLNLDVAKLLLLSISFLTPFIVANAIFFLRWLLKIGDKDFRKAIYLSIILTNSFFLIDLLISYCFKLSAFDFINLGIIVEMFIILDFIVDRKALSNFIINNSIYLLLLILILHLKLNLKDYVFAVLIMEIYLFLGFLPWGFPENASKAEAALLKANDGKV